MMVKRGSEINKNKQISFIESEQVKKSYQSLDKKEMRQNDLVGNIQQAREHIRRLKKQAQTFSNTSNIANSTIIANNTVNNTNSYNINLINSDNINLINSDNSIIYNTNPTDNQFALNQYVNQALYSLVKNDNQLTNKVQQYKNHRLPSIYEKPSANQGIQQQQYYLNGYRKLRKEHSLVTNPKRSLNKSKLNSVSTKPDDSMSFTITNRKIKIHSFNDKHKPIEINSQSKLSSIIQYQNTPIPQIIIAHKQGSSHSSIRNRKYQQKLKLVNFNQSTFNNNLPDQPSKTITKHQQSLNKYDSLVDNFSNHYFMVIHGHTATDTPEYASYQRIYKTVLHQIQLQVKQLQKILANYKVKYAKFDGKKLAYLCLKQNIKRQQLIDCLVEGKEQLLQKIPQTRYKGKQGKDRAVNKVIAYWRMTTTRRRFLLLKEKTIKLQGFFRRHRLRLQLESSIIARNDLMTQRFQQRQLQFQRCFKSLTQKKRIQIHINSIECDQEKRLTIQNFHERHNIQLSRIFRLKDQNLILIYISPKEIPFEVTNYYHKILQLSDVKNYKDRLFFISPPPNKLLPQHLSTTKLLYYCSSTLKQLKNITQATPTIIYPGYPSNQLIKIADFLNSYLYCGEPNKMKLFLSKSQTKRLLKNLCIQTLPGSMEMYDYGEFLNTFSVLIVKNPQISTWVLKIDDQFQGRGIAYIQLGKSKIISSLLKKIEYQESSQIFATDLVSEPANQEITIKIRDYLKQKLPHKLVIVTPTLYRNYEEFLGRFIKKGGVIEAHPPCQREYLTYPCVTFCLQPDGETKILTTYQKVLSQPFKSIACEFPQKSLQYEQILSLCRQLTESFKIRKLFGYFTIDLINYRKNQQSKFWVIGIEPYVNNYASSFYLFDALMQGKYIQQKNTYLTEVFGDQTSQKDNCTIRTSVSSGIQEQKSLKKSMSSQSQTNLSTRTYIFIPHFLNKNFSKINIKQFFKQARIEEFNFDIAQKHGICMMLFDQLTSGQLGLMAVSESKDDNVERLKKVLSFIAKITNLKSLPIYGKSELEPSTDAIQVTDIISKFLTLQRRQKRRDAKKKAIEKHKNKQDLDLII